ncbi:alpha/beta fold hydrolase [Sulfitobacter mediterraneus]|uniref:alpha/beta fold hydrolase n=1 Tax=Sulfitobacter mediterraneus TaxID=83219 RepID=UPI0021A64426|nr:alpha/beta hydrolase [Sulfitobacter mediterraneus]UWR10335.1 alpha/beta hydrolase [Sulfitobacter mediterraneus]
MDQKNLKRSIRALFIAIAFSSSHSAFADEAPAPITAVLVHGAFADGSSWHKVIPELHDAGLNVISVQNPLSSLEDDVATTLRAIDSAEGSVVLVGHSWGGIVITEAGMHDKVQSLVYISSYAPSVGESLLDIAGLYETPESFGSLLADQDGYLRLPQEAMQKYFAHDVAQDEVAIMASVQGRINSAALVEPVSLAAWQYKPTWFVVSEEDQIAPVDMQEALVEKIEATPIRIPSSHVPMVSFPQDVAAAILSAAQLQ